MINNNTFNPTRIQIRRDTSTNWTNVNPILADGEQSLETDTRVRKTGDGITAYNDLDGDAGGSSVATSIAYSAAVRLDTPDPGLTMTLGNLNNIVSSNTTLTHGTLTEGASCECIYVYDGTHTLDFTTNFYNAKGFTPASTAAGARISLSFFVKGGSALVFGTDLPALTIAPVFSAQSAPTPGHIGTPYSYTFVATGATSYAVASGSLPAGVTLNTSSGVISGTPTSAGASSFVISATNAGGSTNSTSQAVTIQVAAPVFAAQSAPGATQGSAYSYTYVATGAVSYALGTGSFPAGLVLNSTTGVLSGTPTTAATSTFTVTATNGGGTASSSSQSVVVAASGRTDSLTNRTASVIGSPSDGGSGYTTSTSPGFATNSTGLYSVNSNTDEQAVFETTLGDGTATLDFVEGPNTTSSYSGIILRYVDASNFLFVLAGSNNVVYINERVANVDNTLNTYSTLDWDTAQPLTLKVTFSGTSIAVFIAQTSGLYDTSGTFQPKGTTTTTRFQTATKAGIRMFSGSTQHLKNLHVA